MKQLVTLSLLVFGFVVTPKPAQLPLRTLRSETTVGVYTEFTSGLLHIVARGTEQTVAIPITHPGSRLVSKDAMHILAGGASATEGRIVRLTRNADGQYALMPDLWQRQGAFVAGVAYSAATLRLYILEPLVGTLEWVPYQLGDAIPAGGWVPVAMSAPVPELADTTSTLRLIEDGIEPVLALVSVTGGPPTKLITDRLVGGALVTSPPPDDAVITDPFLAPGQTLVHAQGLPGLPIALHRMDDPSVPVVGSSTIPSTGAGLVVVPPLEWGSIYGLRSGQNTSPTRSFLTPELRMGIDEVLDGGSVRPWRRLGLQAYVGHQWFAPTVTLDFNAPIPPIGAAFRGIMLIGFLGTSHIFADYPYQGQYLLSPVASIESQGYPSSGGRDATARVRLPLHASELSGSVILLQWIVERPSGVFHLTGIAGFMIRDNHWVAPGTEYWFSTGANMQSASSSGRSGTPSSPRRIDRLTALAWLRGSVPGRVTEVDAATLDAIRHQLSSSSRR
jgi:hypothetical protein